MKIFRFGGVAAVLLCGVSGGVKADITPSEVWQEFQALYAGFGMEVTATTTLDGADLIVSDIVAQLANPSDKNQRSDNDPMEVPYDLTLRDLGDGTVELILPDDVSADFLEALNDIGEVEEVQVSQEGLKTIVSGAPGDMTLNYTADTLSYLLKGISGDNDGEKIDITVNVTDMVGSAKITEDGLKTYLADLLAKSADLKMAVREGEKQVFNMDVRYNDLAMLNAIDLARDIVDPEDLIAMMQSGFAINDITFSHKGLAYTYMVDDAFPITGDATSEEGTFGFAFTQDGVAITQTSQAASTNFSGVPGMMPPMAAEVAGFDMELLMPLVKSETPKDYTVEMNLRDLTLGEDAWAMFDPTQELPREPINIGLTATGQANVLVDIFQDEEPAPGEPEGEFHSLSLSNLLVQFAGAELTGQGDFTFDNSDLTSFDGMPRPEGQLDVKLTGGNTLIDKLVTIGLIQEEQVMGARMMMAIFTNQVEGEDTMTSKLVVDEAGGVFANGQQIK